MKLRTVVRDCLFLNWALPADALPEPPAPLRYQRHAWQGRDYAFVSALLFHHDAVRWSAFPLLRVGYPQLNVRLYVLDEDGMPAVWFMRELMPAWAAPGARRWGRAGGGASDRGGGGRGGGGRPAGSRRGRGGGGGCRRGRGGRHRGRGGRLHLAGPAFELALPGDAVLDRLRPGAEGPSGRSAPAASRRRPRQQPRPPPRRPGAAAVLRSWRGCMGRRPPGPPPGLPQPRLPRLPARPFVRASLRRMSSTAPPV